METNTMKAAGKMPKKQRTRRALLGVICHDGIVPIYAWVEKGQLQFHRQHARFDPPPISLKELYCAKVGRFEFDITKTKAAAPIENTATA